MYGTWNAFTRQCNWKFDAFTHIHKYVARNGWKREKEENIHLPIVVNKSGIQRIQIEYESKRTATQAYVIHAVMKKTEKENFIS